MAAEGGPATDTESARSISWLVWHEPVLFILTGAPGQMDLEQVREAFGLSEWESAPAPA
jgi:hypothetical protein